MNAVAGTNAARITPRLFACLAATWIVWGSTYFAIKIALVSFPPFFQVGTRLLVAGALLFLWVSWRGQASTSCRLPAVLRDSPAR